ncbi:MULTISPECIES: hypothetical protein [Chryseobacterium]|uniref:LysM domain-containing protein n=1 Tax=Candidatus Chryseobacterium massiliense TaxID=204089 RepID=A0A3D9B3X0_9FLAO|nr:MULTISPECIES: hypothetical protein [Chryseobacterium]REC47882.1 hypothetical protein DRF68_12635 [Candidatus Chryseobacterium massiliae]
MKITVLNNQSFLDIAIQHTGTVFNAFAIAAANGMSITEALIPGTQLIIPDTVVIDTDIRDYFKSKGIKPATSVTEEIIPVVKAGIGKMQITKTFKVSKDE